MMVPASDQARKLRRAGKDALLQGLPLPTNEPPWLGAALLMLDKLVGARQSGASEAATIALDLLEATMSRRSSPQRIECARGCSYCCTSVVSATAPEVFRLARFISHNAAGRPAEVRPTAILERAAARANLTLEQIMKQRPACVLLIDGACSAYTARPGNCRRLLSTSRAACKADFEGTPTRIPVIDEAMQKSAHVRALLLAAVTAAGHSTTSYELTQALTVVLRDSDAEARWLAGEDVFAEVAIRQEPGPAQAAIDHWLTRLKRLS